MPPYSIRRSSIAQIRANEHGLTRAHYAEVFGLDHANPDWASMQAIDEGGDSIALAVWDDLRLVGYAVGTLAVSPHDRRHLCIATWFYVHPAARSFGLWRQLRACLTDAARAEGAEALLWGAGHDTQFDRLLARLAERGAVRLVEHTYEEALS